MSKKRQIPTYKYLWCKIRYYQQLNSITDTELAQCLGISVRTLNNYDKDAANITLGTIDKFLNATTITIYELLELH